MYLEIISPETTLFQGEVSTVSLPGTDGSFQILENHAPIVSTLHEGVVTINGQFDLPEASQQYFESVSKTELSFKMTSGTVEMKNNKIILLSD